MIGAQNNSLLVLNRNRETVDFLKDKLFSTQNTCDIYTHMCVTGRLLFTTVFTNLFIHFSTNRTSVNLPGNLYSLKLCNPFCWDVKQCHIQEEINGTAKNLKSLMRSVRPCMDFKEDSQGLFQCTIRSNCLEFCK
jgi:hypothetical protein